MRFLALIVTFIILTVIGFSCSRINQESQDHYDQSRGPRHGIIVQSRVDDQYVVAPLDEEAVGRGRDLYRNHCMSCHGPDGEGPKTLTSSSSPRHLIPPNLKDVVRNIPEFTFYLSTSQWQAQMPGWQRPLTDKERDDIAEYLKSLVR